MRIIILENEAAVSRRAADILCSVVEREAAPVLGLATGSTPLGTYRELARRAQAKEVDFANCTTFNLDEYVGISAEHPQSYRTFMEQNLFGPAGFAREKCSLPQSESSSLSMACEEYEQAIDEAGGIHIQLLGIGGDGHIAFNEPGSSLASRTRVKALTKRTRNDNARFFEAIDEVPKLAITMGIGTILESEQIIILATGAQKAPAVAAFIEGPITAQVPASALHMHPRVTALLDEAAASRLQRCAYYREVEKIQADLEASETE